MSVRRRAVVALWLVPFAVACGDSAPGANTAANAVGTAVRPGGASAPASPAQSSAAPPTTSVPVATGSAPTPPGGSGPGAAPSGLTTAAPRAPAGTVRFVVVPQQSTATFRVREQLAGVQFPGDAVGATGMVTGQLTLRPDGGVVSDASRVTVDLRDLKSDDPRRDGFIKDNTLQVSRFPVADFVPTRMTGGPSSLPASGEHAFQLIGQMTAHGVTKEQVWEVKARRDGPRLTGLATTSFKFGDYGMTPPRVPMVLSILDEIRLEVNLVADQG